MVLIGFPVFVVCVECHSVYVLTYSRTSTLYIPSVYVFQRISSGLFAPAFSMSVVVPAAFEASAYRYIVINVAYRPLRFEFVL